MRTHPNNPIAAVNEVSIPLSSSTGAITAFLAIPREAAGIVVFAHGSGSSRHSRRNQHVAQILNHAGFATLLLDLLTPAEDQTDQQTAEHRFDIHLLAQRVTEGVHWVHSLTETEGLKTGLFGASTGAAAALIAAVECPENVHAVVSRGGRPDLAESALEKVHAPTLLIVGGNDDTVLELNRTAFERIPAKKRLDIIPGASHLFEEPGTLDAAANAAKNWFSHYVGSNPTN